MPEFKPYRKDQVMLFPKPLMNMSPKITWLVLSIIL